MGRQIRRAALRIQICGDNYNSESTVREGLLIGQGGWGWKGGLHRATWTWWGGGTWTGVSSNAVLNYALFQ